MTDFRLSKLQKQILIKIYKSEIIHNIKETYDNYFIYNGKGCTLNKVNILCHDVKLKEGVVDLREICFRLAIENNQTYSGSFIKNKFQASFSRSVRNLIIKKYLNVYLSLIPIDDNEKHPLAIKLSDGNYISCSYKQVRFVTLNKKTEVEQICQNDEIKRNVCKET